MSPPGSCRRPRWAPTEPVPFLSWDSESDCVLGIRLCWRARPGPVAHLVLASDGCLDTLGDQNRGPRTWCGPRAS